MGSSHSNHFGFSESDDEDLFIPVVNPNKHVSNQEDGGRKRKLRHVSKIENLRPRGKEAINECRTDLFGAGRSEGSQADLPLELEMQFPEIPEARIEESPSPNQD